MCRTLVLVYSILTALTLTNTARILAVFPTASISHQVVFRPLTQELARRGHEVVVITTDPAFPKGKAPENLTEIDLHDLSYGFRHKLLATVPREQLKIGVRSGWMLQFSLMQLAFDIVEVQIKSEEVQQLINEKRQFDLILVEAYMRPALMYSYIFKAPVIQISSFGVMIENLESVGASTHPMFYPIPHRRRLYNLTFWEKTKEYFFHFTFKSIRQYSARIENEMLQRVFGKSVPSVNQLENNVDMLFLNVHPIWMDNQPMPPNVVFMGGLHQKPMKDLPKDLKSYLDSSKNGVIYVSFGTNVQPVMLDLERLKVLTESFSDLPYDFLFKWTADELPGKPDNVKISKWLPQSDLLRHPNVKAFVMQGGLQSTDEAITAGVPLICIPMLGDQWYNAEKYVHLKIGLQLDFMTFTKTQLKEAIETVVTDKSYRENIIRLRDRINDQPQTPLERAVWWIEYVLRHGGARHLRAATANVSLAEYYELELVLVVLTIFFILLIIVSYCFITLWYFISSKLAGSKLKLKQS